MVWSENLKREFSDSLGRKTFKCTIQALEKFISSLIVVHGRK